MPLPLVIIEVCESSRSFFVLFCLAGCHHGVENNDAVRQGVLDYLATKGMTGATMDINVTKVTYDGDKADAMVSFAAKGTGAAQMSIQYQLEKKDNKWAVVGKKDANQHGGAARHAGRRTAGHGAARHG